MAFPCSHLEGSVAFLIRLVDINTGSSQQQLDAFRVAELRSPVEGSFAILIRLVDVCSCGNQQLQFVRVPIVYENSLIIIRDTHGFELILGIFFGGFLGFALCFFAGKAFRFFLSFALCLFASKAFRIFLGLAFCLFAGKAFCFFLGFALCFFAGKLIHHFSLCEFFAHTFFRCGLGAGIYAVRTAGQRQ